MNHAELLTEASDLIKDCETYNFGLRAADRLAHDIAPRLVTAIRVYELENARLNGRVAALETIIRQHGQSHHFAAGSL